MTIYQAIKCCRLCGEEQLIPVFDLGEHYIIDFPRGDDPAPGIKAPLQVVQCGSCGLAQLAHTVDRDLMYRDYHYLSGTSETMRSALKDVVGSALIRCKDGMPDAVLDIGSNDGTLLSFYPKHSYRAGVDPSNVPGARDLDFFAQGYFSREVFERLPLNLSHHVFDIITAIAMFYDVDQPSAFLRDVDYLLADDGIFICQMNYLPDVLANNAVDFFSHEHLTHWSLKTLQFALEPHDLQVFRVETFPLNGGTARFFINHRGKRVVQASLDTLLDREPPPSNLYAWRAFIERLAANGDQLRALIKSFNDRGEKVFVRGASTRGNAVLQYYGLSVKELPYAADRDPAKWGRKMVGTNIPIISEEEAKALNPAAFLLLPYSYLKQFRERDREYLEEGGIHLVPLPTARII